MPAITEVLGRSDIFVHWGCFPKDTQGCVLIGKDRISDNALGNSRDAFADLEEKLNAAWANNEKITIDIRDECGAS